MLIYQNQNCSQERVYFTSYFDTEILGKKYKIFIALIIFLNK